VLVQVSCVESYLSMDYMRGVGINYATWESAVHGFANQVRCPFVPSMMPHRALQYWCCTDG
jgi:hypothetical protein